jgi:hypothetical protein
MYLTSLVSFTLGRRLSWLSKYPAVMHNAEMGRLAAILTARAIRKIGE